LTQAADFANVGSQSERRQLAAVIHWTHKSRMGQ
jgi:hypothetical protein